MLERRIFGGFNRIIERTRRAYSRRRTERLIHALPPELRKDIGWPDAAGKDAD